MKPEEQIKALAELSPVDDQRFVSKIQKTDSCWLWTGVTVRGYGVFQLDRKLVKAHRVSYEKYRGKIPAGLFVCHRCDNKLCVNPDHLFVGTAKDNTSDMMSKNRHGFASMSHCSFGHTFDSKNTKVVKMKNGSEWRKCRKCDAKRARERRAGLR